MKRCIYCHRVLWPWQKYGARRWRSGYLRSRWHLHCRRAAWVLAAYRDAKGTLTDTQEEEK